MLVKIRVMKKIDDILQEMVDIIECYATNDNITDERYDKEKQSLIRQAERGIMELIEEERDEKEVMKKLYDGIGIISNGK